MCDLCHQWTDRLERDHDHVTDRIRGWVCRRCNFLLGVAADSPDLLTAALTYLADPPRDGSYSAYRRQQHNDWVRNSSRAQEQRRASNERWRAKHKKVGGQWVLK